MKSDVGDTMIRPLQQLIEQWRHFADQCRADPDDPKSRTADGYLSGAAAIEDCADELEAAILAAAVPQPQMQEEKEDNALTRGIDTENPPLGTAAETRVGAAVSKNDETPAHTPGEWFLTEQTSSHDCYEKEYRLGARWPGVMEHYLGRVYHRQDAAFIVAAANAPASPLPTIDDGHPYADGTLARLQHDVTKLQAVIVHLEAELRAALSSTRSPSPDLRAAVPPGDVP